MLSQKNPLGDIAKKTEGNDWICAAQSTHLQKKD